jgi:sensor domain CHASE-containing protein
LNGGATDWDALKRFIENPNQDYPHENIVIDETTQKAISKALRFDA